MSTRGGTTKEHRLRYAVADGQKRCNNCEVVKSVDEFYVYSSTSYTGYRGACKLCFDAKLRDYSKKKWESIKHNYAERGYHRWNSIRMRATRNGIFFDLDRESFIQWFCDQPRNCVYCGIPEDHQLFPKSDAVREYRLQVDRKDANVGYTMSNITLACPRCNLIKSDVLTFDEMCEIAQRYIRSKWET